MLFRFAKGFFIGALVGSLIGAAWAGMGFVVPGALAAYVGSILVGCCVGLVTGKPIWAKDAKVENLLKAIVGSVVGAGLLYFTRKWGAISIPSLWGPWMSGTLGTWAVSAFAIVGSILGAFFALDDNDSGETTQMRIEAGPTLKSLESAPSAMAENEPANMQHRAKK